MKSVFKLTVLRSRHTFLSRNVAVEWLTLLLPVGLLEAPGSGAPMLTEGLSCVSTVLQVNTEIFLTIGHLLTSLLNCYSVILPLDAL